MHLRGASPAFLLLPLVNAYPASYQACPLLGQQYPTPTQISKNSKFQLTTKALEVQLNKTLNQYPFNETTFSIGMFSTAEDGLIYQYHHTDALVSNQNNSIGAARKVDADSVYRIASISKLLTVYTWLVTEGERHWSDPVTDYIPELLNDQASWNSLTPDFSEITVGDLAGQMAGLARDFGLADAAPANSAALPIPKALQAAFPKLPSDQVPACGYQTANGSLALCTKDQYISGLASESPIFSTAYTPVYSNEGFALLGLALAAATNTTLEDVFSTALAKPLGLNSTFSTPPNTINEHDVIPGNPLKAGWSNDFGVFAAAGGFYSSTNDFATIGKSILESKLLTEPQTNRWLKPTSFVEDLSQGVGRPWEIFRTKVNSQTIDIYSKSGDWGVYHSFLGIVPAYGIGLSIMTAEDLGSAAGEVIRGELPNKIFDAVLPVMDLIARQEASVNFAGTYTSNQTNSTLTIEADAQGLLVTKWVNNGVDLYSALGSLFPDLVYRILPNQLYSGNMVGFTSYYTSATPPAPNGTFPGTCVGWFDVDELTYGNIPVGQMVFDTGTDGKAISVSPRAFRTTLKRIG